MILSITRSRLMKISSMAGLTSQAINPLRAGHQEGWRGARGQE